MQRWRKKKKKKKGKKKRKEENAKLERRKYLVRGIGKEIEQNEGSKVARQRNDRQIFLPLLTLFSLSLSLCWHNG